MGEKMTLEQVRDWHNEEVRRLNKSQHPFPNGSTVLRALAKHHKAMADAIDAHLATPAQTVDVEAVREVILQLRAYQNLSDKWPQEFSDMELDAEADKLSQAIGDKT